MSNFWPKKWSQSLKKFEWWSLARELLKQYLTKKQNGCSQNWRDVAVPESFRSCFEFPIHFPVFFPANYFK